MSVFGVMLNFLVAQLSNREVKVVFIDVSLNDGIVHSIRGKIIAETENTINTLPPTQQTQTYVYTKGE